MASSLLYSIQQAQDPLHEDITPEIHHAVTNPVVRVVSAATQLKYDESAAKRNPLLPPPGSYRQVFLRRKNKPTHAYQIVPHEAFQPILLSHGGPPWGHVFMGYMLPKYSFESAQQSAGEKSREKGKTGLEGLYREPIDEDGVQKVAIKRLDLRVVLPLVRDGCREDPFREIHRLQTIGDDIHVLSIIEALQDRRYLYIITPWCERGSLLDHMPLTSLPTFSLQSERRQTSKRQSTEDKAKMYYEQMMQALEYIHDKHGIGHRDIKPANFLITKSGRLLLSDLAMSFKIPPSGVVKHIGRFGTMPYLPPEVYAKQPFDARQCDLWACTVSLFNLITGISLYSLPSKRDSMFYYTIFARGLSRNHHNEQVQELIMSSTCQGEERRRNRYLRVSEAIMVMSDDLLRLFENTLAYHPSHRWTRKEVLQSRWMRKGNKKDKQESSVDEIIQMTQMLVFDVG